MVQLCPNTFFFPYYIFFFCLFCVYNMCTHTGEFFCFPHKEYKKKNRTEKYTGKNEKNQIKANKNLMTKVCCNFSSFSFIFSFFLLGHDDDNQDCVSSTLGTIHCVLYILIYDFNSCNVEIFYAKASKPRKKLLLEWRIMVEIF